MIVNLVTPIEMSGVVNMNFYCSDECRDFHLTQNQLTLFHWPSFNPDILLAENAPCNNCSDFSDSFEICSTTCIEEGGSYYIKGYYYGHVNNYPVTFGEVSVEEAFDSALLALQGNHYLSRLLNLIDLSGMWFEHSYYSASPEESERMLTTIGEQAIDLDKILRFFIPSDFMEPRIRLNANWLFGHFPEYFSGNEYLYRKFGVEQK
ncbi:hypothetical protein [Vibrio sp. 1S139]|uniref:hypothetical protein n=1 Tax=Vibrio sp. 1S139 TaxID=3230006 RepID=UPI00352FB91D